MYNRKFENVPDIFGAPGLALVMVTVKKVRRLKILALALAAVNMPDQGELAHLVHVHDPMHNSDLIHVLSRYSHSFIVFVVCFFITLLYNVSVT